MDSFGEAAAEVYDAELRGDELSAVALLETLACGGPALELAIGTGRIALPLAARGIRVDGVDLSSAMVTKLRAKPGGEQLSVTLGDMADVPVQGTYRLIFLVFNTLFNLLTRKIKSAASGTWPSISPTMGCLSWKRSYPAT
jgi:Methyltransferase domain